MRFETLDEWLAWQERLHPSAIDLGLERCAEVARRMRLLRPPWPVVTVAGTNGKGSCAMMLEACLRAGGYRTGTYTSPHLNHYRERIRVAGAEIDEASLVEVFAQIDAARGDISLTFFEFGTLAALAVFARAAIDVAVLEVGLGGRLDAVNILDADYALISSVGVDHVDWLGGDRESIGAEKAGILRADAQAVYAERDPPRSVLARAATLGTPLRRLGVDYDYEATASGWRWWAEAGQCLESLPPPALAGARQLQNAAAVLAVLDGMRTRMPVSEQALRSGIAAAALPGRLEVLGGPVTRILDVAHNPQAAAVLAQYLAETRGSGRTFACVGMLADKDATGCAAALRDEVDGWFAGGLDGARGQTGAALAERVRAVAGSPVRAFASMPDAYRGALAGAGEGDRVVVFGSFLGVAVIRALESSGS